jgi:hypothetical protein
VREVHEGLGVIQVQSSRLAASTDDAHRASLVAAIEHQVKRMQQMLRETGQPAGSRAPGPPQTPPTPPRGVTAPGSAAAPEPGPRAAAAVPVARASRAASEAPAARAAAPAAAVAVNASALDGLVAEMVQLSRPALARAPSAWSCAWRPARRCRAARRSA